MNLALSMPTWSINSTSSSSRVYTPHILICGRAISYESVVLRCVNALFIVLNYLRSQICSQIPQ